MKRARLIAAVAALVMTAGAATAADIPQVTATAPPPPPPPPPPVFDWNGPYIGAHIGGNAELDPFVWEEWVFGAQAGLNMVFDGRFLAGAEIMLGVQDDGGDLEFIGTIYARGGFILGERLLVYAKVGLGTEEFDEFNFQFGGGVEVGLGTAMSVFAEVLAVDDFGEPCCDMVVRGGFNFHLGN